MARMPNQFFNSITLFSVQRRAPDSNTNNLGKAEGNKIEKWEAKIKRDFDLAALKIKAHQHIACGFATYAR
jgi:hypothetical protein